MKRLGKVLTREQQKEIKAGAECGMELVASCNPNGYARNIYRDCVSGRIYAQYFGPEGNEVIYQEVESMFGHC